MSRQCIKKYFKRRTCFTFTLPATNKQLLRTLDAVPDEKLSKKFLMQAEKFCTFVIDKAQIKKLENGQPMVGRSEYRRNISIAICCIREIM
jgi:hypothetical protein